MTKRQRGDGRRNERRETDEALRTKLDPSKRSSLTAGNQTGDVVTSSDGRRRYRVADDGSLRRIES